MKKVSFYQRKSVWLAAFVGLSAQMSAHAALCTVSNSGTPVLTTVNPKPFTVPPPSTCLVNGLPGSAGFTGYRTTPVFQQSNVDLKVGTAVVGKYWDRVYCTGTSTTCDGTNNYIFATRIQMLAGSGGAPCPLWSGTTTECFEINDIFRSIPSAATNVQVGYWMGSSSTSGNVDTQLAVKYLEYTGRTFQGLDPANPAAPRTRNNAKIDFRTDVNVFDPDGVNAPWSPWLYVRVNCPSGINTNLAASPGKFSIRFRQGGEEGQIQTFTELPAYLCN